jgi:hypothetical protein
MSRLIATILLAILMFPLAAVFYVVVYVTHEQFWRWSSLPYRWGGYSYEIRAIYGFASTGLLTWAFIAVYWWILWRKQVQWTPKRRLGTVGWVVGAVLLGTFAGAAAGTVLNKQFGAFIGSVTAPLLWVFGTVLAWRESPAEHAERIASLGGADALTCPTCGYNLTGLRGTRCPECGNEFTLDQLLASQPSHAQIELES